MWPIAPRSLDPRAVRDRWLDQSQEEPRQQIRVARADESMPVHLRSAPKTLREIVFISGFFSKCMHGHSDANRQDDEKRN